MLWQRTSLLPHLTIRDEKRVGQAFYRKVSTPTSHQREMLLMKYHVNDSCIGCGLCTSTCPEVFSMGDDNKAVAAESVPAGAESSAEDAMNGCPVTAIEKVD